MARIEEIISSSLKPWCRQMKEILIRHHEDSTGWSFMKPETSMFKQNHTILEKNPHQGDLSRTSPPKKPQQLRNMRKHQAVFTRTSSPVCSLPSSTSTLSPLRPRPWPPLRWREPPWSTWPRRWNIYPLMGGGAWSKNRQTWLLHHVKLLC